jgi:hypothetical protein
MTRVAIPLEFTSRQHGRYLRKARTCRETIQSQPVRIAFSAVASFPKEEVHLGSFVPKDPIAEPGPVMDGGTLDEFGVVGLAVRYRLQAHVPQERSAIFEVVPPRGSVRNTSRHRVESFRRNLFHCPSASHTMFF